MDLSLEFVPEEGKGNVWVGGYLLPLAAVVVRVEDEAPIDHLLQQYGAHAGATFGGSCPYDDGRRFVDFGLNGLVDPSTYDLKGIVGELLATEAERGVFATDIL